MTVWPSACNVRVGVSSPVIRPFTRTPLLDDERRSESRRAPLPFSVTLISIRSVADTPRNVTVASLPEPLNLSVTSPGGTPVRVNWPEPSTCVLTEVPTMVTVIPVVAMTEKPDADQRSAAAAPDPTLATLLTRPTITAPLADDAPRPDGLAGFTAVPALSPQAAEILATATMTTQRCAVRIVELMPGSSSLSVGA